MTRIPDPGFDVRIADWLEADPNVAPTEILAIVESAIPSIPQRRHVLAPWRFPVMTRFALVGAAAATIAVVGLGLVALTSRPSGPDVGASPAPVTTPAPSATLGLSSVFTSERYGYSIGLAPGWVAHPATLTWTGPDNTAPVVDEIETPGGQVLSGASEALRPGQTFTAWLDTFAPVALRPGCGGGAPASWRPIGIGGETGLWQQMCGAGEAVIEHVGRAYVFTWGQVEGGLTLDQFTELLASVRFDPAGVPSPGPTPVVDEAFSSRIYGYSLRHPAGWSATTATTTTPGDRLPDPSGTTVDVLSTDNARLAVYSIPLAAGQSADEWARAACSLNRTRWSPPCEQGPATWRQVPLADGTAWLMVDGDSSGTYMHQESRLFVAVAVAGGRGYLFRMDGEFEEDLFLAILASTQLDPGGAVAAPGP